MQKSRVTFAVISGQFYCDGVGYIKLANRGQVSVAASGSDPAAQGKEKGSYMGPKQQEVPTVTGPVCPG